ncbi:P-loop containing nucleoside triphosphate hydrolase protein [Trichoderma citrinoviride]|uniref:ATP-dependent RNA helicase n=1 Tax=Trichoderma citrinoviride TaxID=58853 RepID=A0A2T4B3J4_9HYPO|nr:P-loop containing nucleoside triphosphate hydrolase protein [Trichoderma citrinoviride]PTB63903.1 P-loop containing nucleoside triphosphate hydrolase protein [Trichoderma citrinoviride]
MYARYIPGQKPTKDNQDLPVAKQSPAPSAATNGGDGLSYARYIPGVTPQKQAETPNVQRFEDESDSPKPKRKRDDGEPLGEPLQEPLNKKRKEKGLEAVPQDSESAEEVKKTKKSRRSEQDGALKESKDGKKEKKKNKDRKREEASDEEHNESTSDGQNPEQTIDSSTAHPEDSEMVDAADGITPEPAEQQPKKPKKEKKKKSQDAAMNEAAEEEAEDTRHKAVFERKAKSLKYAEIIKEQGIDEEPEEPAELHGLEPLPQPARTAPSTAKPTYETLPPWLSAPIRVSVDTRTPFTELGILPKAARVLEQKGYTEAFAVQTAALPLLLPSNKQQPGDLLVSAATGSGKTLAYALPIVRDVSNSVVTRLRALVVLPTRELVKQAQEVFELCAKAYEGEDRKRVRVGIAIGNQSLASEQDLLVGKETRYDPEAYQQLEQEASSSQVASASEDDLDALLNGPDTHRRANPRLGPWQGQVVDFHSKVDVLICTPGRLVEHLDQTPGFSLSYIRWLVVDEADKLLAQSFQGWLDVVLDKFKTSSGGVFGARDFPDMPHSGVRKILLSATLTRDLSLLNQLALWRPRLIAAKHEHPATKPQSDADSDTSSDDSSSDSDLSSESSDDDSDATSSDSDTSSSSSSRSTTAPAPRKSHAIPRSLIFTKSNESALRLSRLLALLDPSLAPQIGTLTSTTPTSVRRKTLRAFTTPSSSSPLRLIIASDLVARGIDIPKLPHVVNYDLPPSVAGYVHRVGRTARAGRPGCAWTLVGDGESGWFWGKIGKSAAVKRAQKVGRVIIEEMSEERIEEYESALEKLGKEALESRKK